FLQLHARMGPRWSLHVIPSWQWWSILGGSLTGLAAPDYWYCAGSVTRCSGRIAVRWFFRRLHMGGDLHGDLSLRTKLHYAGVRGRWDITCGADDGGSSGVD